MSDDALPRSLRFRQARETEWRALDGLLSKIERKSVSALSAEELLSMPVLYRSAMSSLSVARATSLDQNLTEYLESLCTRAYFFVYGPRTTLWERVRAFLATDWPAAVQALWRETLIAAALLLLGVVAAYVLTLHDPDWYYAFVPKSLAAGRDPSASTAFLHATLYKSEKDFLAAFATMLFTHNAQIAIFAFALGFAFCVPTALLMAFTGCMMGAMFALYAPRGLGLQLGGWLFIHGVSELFAITLAGAAGFRIGWRVMFPGDKARVEAVADAGRQGAVVMFGVVLMLMVAGCLEGIGRQVITNDIVRYAIAGLSGLVWTSYFYWPRRRTVARP